MSEDNLYGGGDAPKPKRDRLTVPALRKAKASGRKLVMVTCYDATFGRIVDNSDVDIVLVGDSLGNVIQGRDTTLPVTLDDMVYHTAAVRRGVSRALLVGDMPFMTFQINPEDTLRNAGRLMAEGGCQMVKLEGGAEMAATVDKLTSMGVPVMGHIGLTPQSVHALGGNRVQGRGKTAADRLKGDALALQEAGAGAIVLELVPADLAREISESLEVPTIGIGAGAGCDGQVLVLYDLLGMNKDFNPKFLRKYDDLHTRVTDALNRYAADTRAGTFPSNDESF